MKSYSSLGDRWGTWELLAATMGSHDPKSIGPCCTVIRKLRIVVIQDANPSDHGRRDRPVVVETDRFLRDTKPLMSDTERGELVAFIGTNPEAGKIIPETGGVRKVRWALPGMGKRGGARVIYYYHSERLPVFLLAAYAKNEKANLSQAERNMMKQLVPVLVRGYTGSNRR